MTAGGSKQDAAVDESSALRSLLAGAGAGVVCTLLCAPLDVTKVRLQVQGTLGGKNRYSGGIYSSLRKIYTEEGVRGVFKGVGPALVTVPLFWGVYWPIYDKMKSHFGRRDSGVSSSTGHILSAVVAGATSDVITNPFWVTRTRIQTLALHSEVPVSSEISTVQMMRHIYETEGWTAFYKGLGASFLGLSHVAIQFPLYEYLKREARRGEDRPETFFELLFASTTAKLVASSITYPHEVIRARLQDGRGMSHAIAKSGVASSSGRSAGAHSSNTAAVPAHAASLHTSAAEMAEITRPRLGIVSVLRDIVQKEGVAALWSGLRVSMFRIVPATASTFLAYEYISRYLKESARL